jgi:hypothetical protein
LTLPVPFVQPGMLDTRLVGPVCLGARHRWAGWSQPYCEEFNSVSRLRGNRRITKRISGPMMSKDPSAVSLRLILYRNELLSWLPGLYRPRRAGKCGMSEFAATASAARRRAHRLRDLRAFRALASVCVTILPTSWPLPTTTSAEARTKTAWPPTFWRSPPCASGSFQARARPEPGSRWPRRDTSTTMIHSIRPDCGGCRSSIDSQRLIGDSMASASARLSST